MQLGIDDVTVHRDGARVTRRGTVDGRSGSIALHGLPLSLDVTSLQVEVAGGRLVGLELVLDRDGAVRGAPVELEAQVLAAAREADRLAERRRALEEQRDALRETVPDLPDDHRVKPADLAGWQVLDEALAEWAHALQVDIDALRDEERRAGLALRQAREALASASDEASWRRWLPTRVLRLRLEGEDLGEVELAVRYRVPGATWSPVYALHVDPDFRGGRLVMGAVVRQASGEDWSRARLSLSTAPLARRLVAPILHSRRLGRAQPPAASPWRELPADLDALFPDDLPEPTVAVRAALSKPEASPLRQRKGARPPRPMREPDTAGAMPPGAMPPAPVAMSRAAAPTPKRAAAPPPPEEPTGVRPRVLDYPSLRLAGVGEPSRGRLVRVGLDDELRGLDAAALSAWRELRGLRERVERAAGPWGGDGRFTAPQRVHLPSDARPHRISLGTLAVQLDVRYRSVPRSDPRVYRSVRATLAERKVLLPGPVDVHVDGALVLSTSWSGSAAGQPLDLDLGVEEGLRLARNVRYREENTGLFSGGRRVHTEVELSLASSLDRAVRVELYDRIPVAAGDEVEVSLVSGQPVARPFAGEPGRPLKGGLVQQVELAPGGEARATLHWSMSLASRLEVEGGERRG